MTEYAQWTGYRTGALLWRVVPDTGAHRVLPDAAMDLIWDGESLLFAGPDTAAFTARCKPGQAVWGLRLQPGQAHALLGIPARELVDQRFELGELLGAEEAVIDEVRRGGADVLERAFCRLWRRAEPDAASLRLARSLDDAARAGTLVPEIARQHELSERSLRRVSDRVFGYGPKTLMNVHRLQRALALARSGVSLSDASTRAGYADQAHFTRESRRLAATTPAVLVG